MESRFYVSSEESVWEVIAGFTGDEIYNKSTKLFLKTTISQVAVEIEDNYTFVEGHNSLVEVADLIYQRLVQIISPKYSSNALKVHSVRVNDPLDLGYAKTVE